MDGTPLDRATFEARYVIAADTYGALAGPDELDAAWDDYADGRFAALYAEPEPESAVRAARLAAAVARLLADPHAADWRWRNRLRSRVDQLATILLPVAAPDALDPDDDPPARLVYVDDVTAAYPEIFAGPPAAPDEEGD